MKDKKLLTTSAIKTKIADRIDDYVKREMHERRATGQKYADDYSMVLKELLAKSKRVQKLMNGYNALSGIRETNG